MSPFFQALGISLSCDPCRLMKMDRGSLSVGIYFRIQYPMIWLSFGIIRTSFAIVLPCLLFIVSLILIEKDPFYFWKVHLVTWGNNRCDCCFSQHIERISILEVIIIFVAKLLLNY